MVTPTGPGQPAGQPAKFSAHEQLAGALKTQVAKFSDELRLIMNSPHLADRGPALEAMGKVIQALHMVAQQAANLKV